jgi:hypothetical protein
MKLQFHESKIAEWAGKYNYQQEDTTLRGLVPEVRKAGSLTLDQLRLVAHWKSPRSAGRVETNDAEYVRTITSFALQTKCERARIEVLTLLDGVGWPTASVILHFFHCDQYPILDFRALESVGVEVPSQYTFGFWWQYVEFCRRLADRTGHDMRTLDRALWAYSASNQGE